MTVDLIKQCLELVMMKAAGEDRVNDLHHNRYDVNRLAVFAHSVSW